MKDLLTAYEASKKYPLSVSHIRRLMRAGKLRGRQAEVNSRSKIWLVSESSLKFYTSIEHKTGPKPSKR